MSRTVTTLTTVGLLAALLLGTLIGRGVEPTEDARVIAWASMAGLFGALVGLSELLSRYRDEPILASTTIFGFSYLVLNALISVAAFALLRAYGTSIFPAIKQDLFLTAVVAGFGAMVVFRSKLFTYRSPDGQEYAIGPAIVLETTLRTFDQKIDRQRATQRQARIFAELSELTDFKGTAQYFDASLNSFQNLSKEDKAEISRMIEKYQNSLWPDPLKIMALGFAFLNIAGEENFSQVVGNMKSFIRLVDADSDVIVYGLSMLQALKHSPDQTARIADLATTISCPPDIATRLAARLVSRGYLLKLPPEAAGEDRVKLTDRGGAF